MVAATMVYPAISIATQEAEDWQAAFREWLEAKGLRPLTVAAYLQDVRHFARYFAGVNGEAFRPGLLNSMDVRAWWRAQEEAKDAASTRNRRLASLRALVRWANEAGRLEGDPTEGIRRAAKRQGPPRSHEDVWGRLAETAAATVHVKKQTEKHRWLGLRDKVIFGLMARAGLRIGEVAGLDVDDVDLEALELRVLGKGGVEGRVLLPHSLADDLRAWLAVHPGGEALIVNWQGRRLSTAQIRRRVKMVGEAAGVQLRPHDLRHTYIYRLLDAFLQGGMAMPVALDAVRQQARHGDVRTTQAYLRARYSQVREAVERI